MAKKDFTAVKTGSVYDAIAQATAEPAPEAIPVRERGGAPTAEEIQLAREQSRTRGRKGVKMLRTDQRPNHHAIYRAGISAQHGGQCRII